ncbi:phosphatidate cytidylyltransferase, mitochondrial [Lingula anatina]|uniref:Phosphatidate cytidylyltransferase, mitochondrial n=1 Tax=Lingula anatina TaxID=7574 RepID=A0A1S3KIL5_LINAN|nr:phosphatidate cytidylyltransferase, mitochondrial [Lingula anatina]|eukprot:XP_013422051.1 phosphatidate cytidylyltransferase, mitochondrial [Lingula anatina]
MAARQLYKQIISHFPEQNMAFAYGSGVFKQLGHTDPTKNMLDFFFVVDDPVEWHRANIAKNRSHYSFLKYLGSRRVANIQEKHGAGVYFNSRVMCEERLIKYGVISTRRLTADLLDWDTLYVGGRLHKPVMILKEPSGENLKAALHTNLASAVHTALIILPEHFTEEELYCTICNLSYSGDFRMVIGEDKNKVRNIVKPNMEKFRELYEGILDHEDNVNWCKSQGRLEQLKDPAAIFHHLSLLPKTLEERLVDFYNRDKRTRDAEEVLRICAKDYECGEVVGNCVSKIVSYSSWSQSAKSIWTAGIMKSFWYSLEKLKKMNKGSKKEM